MFTETVSTLLWRFGSDKVFGLFDYAGFPVVAGSHRVWDVLLFPACSLTISSGLEGIRWRRLYVLFTRVGGMVWCLGHVRFDLGSDWGVLLMCL